MSEFLKMLPVAIIQLFCLPFNLLDWIDQKSLDVGNKYIAYIFLFYIFQQQKNTLKDKNVE